MSRRSIALHPFSVTVRNPLAAGFVRKERRLAATSSDARAMVRHSAADIVKVSAVAGIEGLFTRFSCGSKARIGDLAEWFFQLRSLLGVNPNVPLALQESATLGSNCTLKQASLSAAREMSTGSIESGFEKFRGILPDLHIQILLAANRAGAIESAVARIADACDRASRGRREIIGALLYPVIVLTMTFALAIAIALKFLPVLKGTYDSVKQPMPALSLVAMQIVDGVLHNWWGVPLLAAVAWWILSNLRNFYDYTVVQDVVDTFPPLRRLLHKLNTANILSSLALMTGAGIPLITALPHVFEITRHAKTLAFFREFRSGLLKGADTHTAASLAARHLPNEEGDTLVSNFKLAAATGDATAAIKRLSEKYDEEAADAIKNIKTVINPLAMIAVGVILGFVVVSVILPISMLSVAILKHSH